MKRASLLLAALLVMPIACVDAPERSADADKANADDGKEQPAVAAEAESANEPKPGSLELSAEELELIDADPKTLSPEQNRKRAYALRKKIMQDPNSPQAQALEEARTAALGGELTPEQANPGANEDKGLVIELPEHLEDQRVSKGEPVAQ